MKWVTNYNAGGLPAMDVLIAGSNELEQRAWVIHEVPRVRLYIPNTKAHSPINEYYDTAQEARDAGIAYIVARRLS